MLKDSRVKSFLSILFLLLLCLIFFIKLFVPDLKMIFTPDLGRSDVYHYNLPIKYLLGSALEKRELPLWTSKVGTGISLLGSGQTGVFNIINLLLYYLLPIPLAFNISYVAYAFVGCIGCFLLGRLLKFSYFTSVFTSIVFIFCGFYIFHLTHTLYMSAAFLPLIMYFLIRFLEKGDLQNALFFSFAISQAIFAGHIQTFFLTLVGVLTVTITYLLFKEEKPALTKILGLLLSLTLGLMMSGIQLIPLIELKSVSVRETGLEFSEATENSLSPKHLLTLIYPFFLGNPRESTYKIATDQGFDIFWEKNAYLGVIPLVLVFISILNKEIRRSFYSRVFIILLIVSFLFSLGKYSPFFFIYLLPPFNLFRVPARFLLLILFSLSILSGFGLEHFFRFLKRKNLGIIDFFFIKLIVISIVFFSSFYFTFSYHLLVSFEETMRKPKAVEYLEDRSARVLTIGAGYPYLTNLFRKGWVDIKYYLFAKNSLDCDMNILFDTSATGVYDSVLTARQKTVQEILRNEALADFNTMTAKISPLSKKMLSLTSTKYVITPFKIDDRDLTLIQEITSDQKHAPFYIYENNNFLERARIVFNYKNSLNYQDTIDLIKSNDFSPEETVVLENTDLEEFEQSTRSFVRIIREKEESLDIEATTDKKGILVLADSFYPGWKAYIDNVATTIYPANINQRAVVVPQGRHVIKYVYKPDSLKLGAWVSSLGFLIWLFFLVKSIKI